MARKRTGTLVERNGRYFAIVTVTKDGESVRKWVPLGTDSKQAARRKLAREVARIARGETPSAENSASDETFREYSEDWLSSRKPLQARDERSLLTHHVWSEIGVTPLGKIKPAHIKGVLGEAAKKKLGRASLIHIRGVMNRILRSAWEDDLIPANPVQKVPQKSLKAMVLIEEKKKERAILTDAEFAAYWASPKGDVELKRMALAARFEGGLRTGDVNAWDWSMLDRVHFETCIVPRSKTADHQPLDLRRELAAVLRPIWEKRGRPERGPIFPVRRGPRAGQARGKRGTTFASALRRDLMRAGVIRHKCTRPPTIEVKGKIVPNPPVKKNEVCCENAKHDPLFSETGTTLPVDFHSFRRAFNSAGASGGVNVQTMMHLSHHSDAKTHQLYVMSSAPGMRAIPDALVPKLLVFEGGQSQHPATNDNVSRAASSDCSANSVGRPGLEPGTYGLKEERIAGPGPPEAVNSIGSAVDRARLPTANTLLRFAATFRAAWFRLNFDLFEGLADATLALPVGALDTLAFTTRP